MPDANGWPTRSDVEVALYATAPDTVPVELQTQIDTTLQGVIAEFQSPVAVHGEGGTGRTFTPITETRYYDGNGYPQLRVDDIVSGAALTVKAFDTVYPDVVLQTPGNARGWNLLVRPQSSGSILGASYGLSGVFPLGLANIAVTTTFGYAAKVPSDVYLAVCSEATYRLLIEGFIGLDGVGDKLQIGTFEVDTSAMSDNWKISATPPMLHRTYTECVARYRYRDQKSWKRIAASRRMS